LGQQKTFEQQEAFTI